MADTYSVIPSEIASELPALFPGGFSSTSTPSDEAVTSLISTADAIVSFRIDESVGLADDPAAEPNAVLARRFIIDWVKARVIRIVYTGRDPIATNAAAAPFETSSDTTLDLLISQTSGMWGSAIVVRGS